ncbi:hypothetical protein B0J17DRAFT_720537 [Rhizoctonia solani]|nr:hypothetical protein B0J17DRAFT_720537 [Rhizoctonia solani]
MATAGIVPLSSTQEIVNSIVGIHDQLQTSRLLAISAVTLLVYDWVSTLDKEIKYIWGRKWSFARVVYHLNRILPLLLLSAILIPNILFAPSYYTTTFLQFAQRKEKENNIICRCKRIILSYGYGVVGLLAVLCATSIIRCWALYGQTWVLWLLIPALIITVGHALAQVTLSIGNTRYMANPLPGVLEGCLAKLPRNIWLAYLSGVYTNRSSLVCWSGGFGVYPLESVGLRF